MMMQHSDDKWTCSVHPLLLLLLLLLCVQAGHVCGDKLDIIDGLPTGSVRVSFGYSSTLEDAQKFLQFVYECFLTNANDSASSASGSVSAGICESTSESVAARVCEADYHIPADSVMSVAAAVDNDNEMCKVSAARKSPLIVADAAKLLRIFIYPVKSCAAVEVNTYTEAQKQANLYTVRIVN